MQKITKHTELKVYQKAFDAAMQVFELTKRFPKEEAYSLTDSDPDAGANDQSPAAVVIGPSPKRLRSQR